MPVDNIAYIDRCEHKAYILYIINQTIGSTQLLERYYLRYTWPQSTRHKRKSYYQHSHNNRGYPCAGGKGQCQADVACRGEQAAYEHKQCSMAYLIEDVAKEGEIGR